LAARAAQINNYAEILDKNAHMANLPGISAIV
jgi:hypothetical protein